MIGVVGAIPLVSESWGLGDRPNLHRKLWSTSNGEPKTSHQKEVRARSSLALEDCIASLAPELIRHSALPSRLAILP